MTPSTNKFGMAITAPISSCFVFFPFNVFSYLIMLYFDSLFFFPHVCVFFYCLFFNNNHFFKDISQSFLLILEYN